MLLAFATVFAKAADTSPSPPPGYTLVWSDDFKSDPDGPPDPKKWIYEEGFLRNQESQYYTKARLENARVEHGQLVIEGRKESFPNPTGNGPKVAQYTSAALETYGKAAWLYGRIEVRAQLPAGKGVWPAIWMLGTSERDPSVGWPKCGEIDIMELVGKDPNIIHGTLHWFAGKHDSQGKPTTLDHPEAGFHIYAADWTPDFIDISVDGLVYNHFAVKQADYEGQNPFHKPQFLILNLALGGNWGGPIDDSIFPQRMVVDYVRVYQKSPAP
jgi:beta-glucanase (GH16 family)